MRGGGGHTLQHPVQQLFLVGMMAPIHGGGVKKILTGMNTDSRGNLLMHFS